MAIKSAHRAAIARSLGRSSKKSHHQHLQVHRRINPGPANAALIVGGSAEFADLAGKTELSKVSSSLA